MSADREATPSATAIFGTLDDPGRSVAAALLAPQPAGERYHAFELHAKGGLGEVYYAEDAELGRLVALKRIQAPRADDAEARRRFLREAEITAQLQHPGIVPVYGLSADADGRPAYAMRFVEGESLDAAVKRFHADLPSPGFAGEGPGVRVAPGLAQSHPHPRPLSRKAGRGEKDFDSLAFRELLGHFVAVCNAIAYAHSRGVVHRDLKPGNVMLGQFGETLVVDWGLARTVERTDAERLGGGATVRATIDIDSDRTALGAAVGTPAYMSPEQAAGRWDVLGPAADVYSLGATLYALLTGRSPIPGDTWPAMQQRIQRGDYPPPRAVNPAAPAALDAVCRKAMALEPAGRYASAKALATDIERFLADEPVTAYAEPFGVRLRRWVRRHARLVTGIGTALAIGLVALGVVAWQRERARRAVAAESGRKDVALAQVGRANEILGSVFKDLNPHQAEREGKPLQAVLGERLDQATAAIEGEAIGDPLAVARMQMTLGESQLGLGYADKAVRLFTAARATLAGQLGPDHADTLHGMNFLGLAHQSAGRLDVAVPLFEDTLERRTATLGPDHADTLVSMNNLALGHSLAGRLDAALPLYEEALKRRKAALGPDHPDTLVSMTNLAGGYRAAGRTDAGLSLEEEAVTRMRAALGPDHPDTLATANGLGVAYREAGRLDAARPHLEDALRRRRAKLGPDHPDTLVSMHNLAVAYKLAGRLDAALPLYEEALKLQKAKRGSDHPDTLTTMTSLAVGYADAGRLDRALPLHEEAYKLMAAKLGPDHPHTLRSLNNLASGYVAACRMDAALPLLQESLRLRRAKLGPDHPDTLTALNNLAATYWHAGWPGPALPLYEEALARTKARHGPDHPETLATLATLARCYRAAGEIDRALPLLEEAARAVERGQYRHQEAGPIVGGTADCLEALGRFAAAEAWRRKWLAVVAERSGSESSAHAAALVGLGHNLLHQQKWADAEPLLRACLAIRTKADPDAWTAFNTQSLLGDSLLGQRKFADAEPMLVAGYDGLKQRAGTLPPAAKVRVAEAAGRLMWLYGALGKPDEAAKYLDEMWAWADAPAAAKP